MSNPTSNQGWDSYSFAVMVQQVIGRIELGEDGGTDPIVAAFALIGAHVTSTLEADSECTAAVSYSFPLPDNTTCTVNVGHSDALR